MKQKKLLYGATAAFLLAIAAWCVMSALGRGYAVELISQLFWYHDIAYFAVYVFLPSAIAISYFLAGTWVSAQVVFLFLSSFTFAELVVRRIYALYHHPANVSPMFTWLAVTAIVAVALLVITSRKVAQPAPIVVFFVTLFGVFCGIVPHILYLFQSLASMPPLS